MYSPGANRSTAIINDVSSNNTENNAGPRHTEFSVVGKDCFGVVSGTCTHRTNFRGGARRIELGVRSLVTSSNSDENSCFLCTYCSLVHSSRASSFETYIHDRLAEAAFFGIVDSPVKSVDVSGYIAITMAVKDFDGNDGRFLEDTKLLACNSACSMSSVAVTVGIYVVSEIDTPASMASEVSLIDVDAAVNPVEGNILALSIGRHVVMAEVLFVRDTGKSPSDIALLDSRGNLHLFVWLNELDLANELDADRILQIIMRWLTFSWFRISWTVSSSKLPL